MKFNTRLLVLFSVVVLQALALSTLVVADNPPSPTPDVTPSPSASPDPSASPSPAPSDEYSGATPGATPPLTPEQMMKDAEHLACEGTLCKIFSVSVGGNKFTIGAYVGQGNRMFNGSGSSYSVYFGSNSDVAASGTNNSTANPNQLGYGLQVTWELSNCTKVVNVDKSVYEAVTTYMGSLVNHKPGEDSTYPAFTPAEQTMILFYTTIMNLVKGTTCN